MFKFDNWSLFFLTLTIINIILNPWFVGIASIILLVLSCIDFREEIKVVEVKLDNTQSILNAKRNEYMKGTY